MRRTFTDEELRFTLHDAAPLPEGTVVVGSLTGYKPEYAKFGPSSAPRWNDCPGYTGRWPASRPMTEKEFIAVYEQEWPKPEPARCCECHEHMGNDFYFLPIDRCLRRDGKCTQGSKR